MIKVAICDMDICCRKKIRLLCEEFFAEKHLKYTISQYSSGEEMLSDEYPDILLLDVRLKRINGVLVKEILQKMCADTRIIFLAENRNFMSEAFGKNVFAFLMKPVKKEVLYAKLEEIIQDIEGQFQYAFCKDGADVVKVRFRDIVCLEVVGRMTKVYAKSSKEHVHIYTVERPLNKWEEVLPQELFIRTNRNHIINKLYVIDIKEKIELDYQIIIPIGTIYRDKVWEYFYEFHKGRIHCKK